MGQEADRKFAMNVDRCDPLWNAVTLTKQSRLCLMNILCLHFVRNLSKRVVEIRTNNSCKTKATQVEKLQVKNHSNVTNDSEQIQLSQRLRSAA